MQKITLTLILLVLVTGICEASPRQYFARYMIAGTSLTYIRNTYEDSYGYTYPDDEFTWNINVGIPLTKKLFTGLQVLNIYASEVSVPKEYYVIYGLFSQYNFLKDHQHRLFIELSINKGNYCLCDYLPSRHENLYYLGMGLGYDLPLSKRIPGLYLDLAFLAYGILNPIENKDLYTQYIIGINYRLGEGR